MRDAAYLARVLPALGDAGADHVVGEEAPEGLRALLPRPDGDRDLLGRLRLVSVCAEQHAVKASLGKAEKYATLTVKGMRITYTQTNKYTYTQTYTQKYTPKQTNTHTNKHIHRFDT